MKKLALIIALFVACSTAFSDDDWKINLGSTNSVVGVPYAAGDSIYIATNSWTTGMTVDPFEYIDVDGAVYWTPNGGTTGTNATYTTNWNPMAGANVVVTNFTDKPTNKYGTVAGTDGIIWKPVGGSGRESLYIVAQTSDPIYYSVDGGDASVSSGGVILPQYPIAFLGGDPSFEINFYMPTGTSTVHIVEQ